MSKETKRDIVFFLGAGFSALAGLPTMSSFGEESKEDYDRIINRHFPSQSNPTQFSPRRAMVMIKEAADVYYAFQKKCSESKILFEKDTNNLETIFCIAECMYEAKLKGNEFHLDDIENTIDKMKLWIWKTYQQLTIVVDHYVNDNNEKIEIYDNFFGGVENIADRLTVITTNYDFVYEYFSYKNGMPCNYPVENRNAEFVTIKNTDPNDNDKPIDGVYKVYANINGTGVTVCKLHGSVNYFQRKNQEEKVVINNNISHRGFIGKSPTTNDRPAVLALDAIWEINKDEEKYIPAIIPPTYAKLTGQAWLRDIWHEALNALSKARLIIFIGYSIPESDGFMRALFHASMVLRGANKPPNIYVIDPEIEVHLKYHKLFDSMYKNIGKRSFNCETIDKIRKILSRI